MLDILRELHEQMFCALARHEAMTRDHLPDFTTLSSGRWALTRFALDLTHFLESEVYPAVLSSAPGDASAAVQELQGTHRQVRATISLHVAMWPLDKVAGDWEGYRRDSDALRAAYRKQVSAEKSVLYPLLASIDDDDADSRFSRVA